MSRQNGGNGGVSLLSIQLMAARSGSVNIPTQTVNPNDLASTLDNISIDEPLPIPASQPLPSAHKMTGAALREAEEAETLKELHKMIKKMRKAKKQKQQNPDQQQQYTKPPSCTQQQHQPHQQEQHHQKQQQHSRKPIPPRSKLTAVSHLQASTPPQTPPSASAQPDNKDPTSTIRNDVAATLSGSGIPTGPRIASLQAGISSGLASGATTVGPPSLQSSPQRHASPLAGGTFASGTAVPVGSPIGKLSVLISEGRGLRPSLDPYVVCQFQWSEYISEGPRKNSGGVPVNRDALMARAIPMQSRQSSSNGTTARGSRQDGTVVDPCWDHKATFDVVGEHCEIMVSVYDRARSEAFLGQVRINSTLKEFLSPQETWYTLCPREHEANPNTPTGQIKLRIGFHRTARRQVGPDDFTIRKLIGKGTFGQVFLVRKIDTGRIYAMKVLSKKVIVQKREIAHTLGERNILVRTTLTDSPFIVGLKFSFQTPTDLYLVTDYMSGGELFRRLQLDGRFSEERTKFYIAEIILALQHLHDHDIVYRDLKPENILLDANGHIALCDFGLSKANLDDNATTNTFCGTTEYLAPEVLLDENGYTKMVDFWSLGVLVFEMCCGWSPFYAEETQQMYRNIAFGKVRFPRDALSADGRNFVKGLLNRNPRHRLGSNRDAAELMDHPFFSDIDWDALAKKNVVPPFKPSVESELDVSNFDPEFTNALDGVGSALTTRAAVLAAGVNPGETPLSPTMQANFQGFTFVDESALDTQFASRPGRRMSMADVAASANSNGALNNPINGTGIKPEDEWDKGFGAENRMSGVMLSGGYDDVFNNRFDL